MSTAPVIVSVVWQPVSGGPSWGVQSGDEQVSFLIITELSGLFLSLRGKLGNSHELRRSAAHALVIVSRLKFSLRLDRESWQPEKTQLQRKMRCCTSAAVAMTGVPGGPHGSPPPEPPVPLLEALPAEPKLELAIVGSLEVDPAYAAACQAIAADKGVRFLGPLGHSEMLAEMQASDFFISPSRMESFGLALAEARAMGLPIVARFAGNSAAHVDPAAGGRIVETDTALAAECVKLAGDRAELERRQKAAASHRPALRTWADAARDFLAAFTDSGPTS